MYSLSILLSIISVLSVFMADRAVLLPTGALLKQLLNRNKIAICLALLFWIMSFLAIMSAIGIVNAVLSTIVLWILWGSVLTIFEPIKKLLPFYMIVGSGLFIIVETLI